MLVKGEDKPGHAWLQEHLEEDYIAAWFAKEIRDTSVINGVLSRWHNFYVEGMDWTHPSQAPQPAAHGDVTHVADDTSVVDVLLITIEVDSREGVDTTRSNSARSHRSELPSNDGCGYGGLRIASIDAQ